MTSESMEIEKFVREQLEKWKVRPTGPIVKAAGTREDCTVITLSMEPGSGGRIIAECVGRHLGFDVFHRDLIKRIANSSHMAYQVIDSVEKQRLSGVEDFIASLLQKKYFHPDSYQHHLFRIIGTLARHGRAVIVGRGANFIIPEPDRFAVRVIAPFERRIRNVAREFGCSLEEAEKRVRRRESRRRDFIKRTFHHDIGDPHHYDLVLNTGQMPLDAACDALVCAFTGDCRRTSG